MRFLPLLVLGLLAGCIAAEVVQIAPASVSKTGPEFDKMRLIDGFYAEGAEAADLSGDGMKDIIYGPYYWLGPDFKERLEWNDMPVHDPEKYSDNFFPHAQDFTGDGLNDILLIGFPGKPARIFVNPGDPAETGDWIVHEVASEISNESPHWVDLTGDGKNEIVCVSDSTYGYFSPNWEKPLEPWAFTKITPRGKWFHYTHGLGVGDVNGDGRSDLLEAEGWWEQPEGDGLWTLHEFMFAEKGSSQMYAYDFDGDGDNDVLTANDPHGWGVSWYENIDGSGSSFTQHIIVGGGDIQDEGVVSFSQPHGVDLQDMNGDGIKDIITGKRFMAHGTWGDPEWDAPAVTYWIETKRSKEGVTFVPHLIDDDTGVGVEVRARDINDDGIPDVLVGNKKGATIFIAR